MDYELQLVTNKKIVLCVLLALEDIDEFCSNSNRFSTTSKIQRSLTKFKYAFDDLEEGQSIKEEFSYSQLTDLKPLLHSMLLDHINKSNLNYYTGSFMLFTLLAFIELCGKDSKILFKEIKNE